MNEIAITEQSIMQIDSMEALQLVEKKLQLSKILRAKIKEEASEWSNEPMVHNDYKGKPGSILIAWEYGNSLGMNRMQSLQGISVINGRPCIWGDSLLAIVRQSHMCEYVKEWDDRQKGIAYCEVKRKGEEPQTRTFSLQDAKEAGLLNKKGPWTFYKWRMMQMRARAFALRDVFPDLLAGFAMAEEVMDYEPMEKELNPVRSVQVEPGSKDDWRRAIAESEQEDNAGESVITVTDEKDKTTENSPALKLQDSIKNADTIEELQALGPKITEALENGEILQGERDHLAMDYKAQLIVISEAEKQNQADTEGMTQAAKDFGLEDIEQ